MLLMAKSCPIAGIISSWFKACDKLGNGNISIQLLVSYMKRCNHGFLAQRTTHSAIPLTSLPKNTPRKHHARLDFTFTYLLGGWIIASIVWHRILSLLLCLVPKLYFSLVSYSNEIFSFKWELPVCLFPSTEKEGQQREDGCRMGHSHLNESLSFE